MAKKEKPKNKSKPVTRCKKPKATQKAEQRIKSLQKRVNSEKKAVTKVRKQYRHYKAEAKKTKDKKLKRKYEARARRAQRSYNSKNKRLKSLEKQLNKAKGGKKKVTKTPDTDQAKMASIIQAHAKKFTNEGNMAIFPTKNGKESDIVFFSATKTESESNSSNITSYPVDDGAPRKDYARFTSKTITIDGFVADSETGTAHDKWERLRGWHSHHEELTFSGDIYYPHLIISQLDRQYTGLVGVIQCSITFTFVRAAEITTSSKKKKHAKRSKSSKTLAGNRSKRYTAVTIKWGDTLWGLSRKYGKSIKWLQRVNHIKNPNRIYAGRTIYVNDKKHKAKSKIRVR